SHIRALKWLFGVYPDAHVVQLHRDPVECVPSMTSLASVNAVVRGVNVHANDLRSWGRRMCEIAAESLELGILARDELRQQGETQARFMDLRYTDLVRDPISAVESIYRGFGHALSDE